MADELEEITQMIKSLQESMKPIQEAKAELDNQERRAYEFYKATRAATLKKRQELETKSQDAAYKLRQIEAKKAQIEAEALRKKEQEEADRLAKEREANRDAQFKEWDRLTMGAPWRERAKEHQITAGHFITNNRKVILADQMGLGKTLSSIITTDMTNAITTHASPDEPKFGESDFTYEGRYVHVTDLSSNVGITPLEYGALTSEAKAYYVWRTVKVPTVVNGIERPVGRRILYLCPSSLIKNVMAEYRQWTKGRNVTYVGGMTKGERRFALDYVIGKADDFVVICNYEAWRKDMSLITDFIGLAFDTVILDEAHTIKDPKSIGYRGVKELLDRSNPEYVIPMTGTPILNRPQELFTLLTLVNPQRFHRERDFLYNFCEQDGQGKWKFQPGGLDRVAKQIQKNFLRRTKKQAGIVLPERTVKHHDLVVDIETYKAQAEAREHMRKFATIMIDELEGKAITATAIIAMYTRLRQIETWPAGIQVKDPKTGEVKFNLDVEESQKVDYVISPEADASGYYTGLIPEVVDEERIVLFSQFKAPLQEIKRRIEAAGYSACILDGSTSSEERERIHYDFNREHTPDRSKAQWDVVLCNYKVGGVGLNFTAATQLIALDEEWNPGKRDQAFDRIHRMGQTEPVTIHIIRNQKTVDDWLAAIMERKENLVDGFDSAVTDMTGDFKKFLDEDSGLL